MTWKSILAWISFHNGDTSEWQNFANADITGVKMERIRKKKCMLVSFNLPWHRPLQNIYFRQHKLWNSALIIHKEPPQTRVVFQPYNETTCDLNFEIDLKHLSLNLACARFCIFVSTTSEIHDVKEKHTLSPDVVICETNIIVKQSFSVHF